MSVKKKSRNDRIVALLERNRPDLFEALIRLEQEDAEKPKPPKRIPKKKLAEMKRGLAELEKGVDLEVSYEGLFGIGCRAENDQGAGSIDEETVVLVTPEVKGKTRAQLGVSIARLITKLEELVSESTDLQSFHEELVETVYDSAEFGAFSNKVSAFWDEAEALEEEYDDFIADDLG